jgi:hypothetical protein
MKTGVEAALVAGLRPSPPLAPLASSPRSSPRSDRRPSVALPGRGLGTVLGTNRRKQTQKDATRRKCNLAEGTMARRDAKGRNQPQKFRQNCKPAIRRFDSGPRLCVGQRLTRRSRRAPATPGSSHRGGVREVTAGAQRESHLCGRDCAAEVSCVRTIRC